MNSAEDAANIFVSAYPAVAWTDISDKLAPKNNLTIDQARAYAAVTTQAQISQLVSVLAAGLGINFATVSQSFTTSTPASGAPTTTGTSTGTYGTVPSSSGTPSATLPTLTPDLTKGPMAFQVDGNTLITEGTALYQQAQILDNQVSSAIFPKNYRVHLITLQVNVQPKQRDVGYDVYMDISLLPSKWADALNASPNAVGDLPPVVVYPLIISDALELSSVGQSIQMIRQAALQLSGSIGPAGANFGLGKGSNKLNEIVGLDKNSLVTVGRINSNTIRVRLGAENSGSTGLALVPRVYNISLAVMTRADGSAKNPRVNIESLEAVSHASLLSTENGTSLPPARTRGRLALDVNKAVCDYSYTVNTDGCGAKKQDLPGGQCFEPKNIPDKPDPKFIDANLNILRAADRQDIQFVQNHICSDGANLNTMSSTQEEMKLRRMLASLVEVQFNSLYSDFLIPLKPVAKPQFPDLEQVALYADDQKSSTTAVLRGGKGLNSKDPDYWASILVKGKTGPSLGATTKLMATSVTVVGDGSEVDISFPSLAKAGLEPNPDGSTKKAPLCLYIGTNTDDDKPYVGCYPVKDGAVVEKPAPNPVSVSSAVLIADKNNVARLTVQVGKIDPPASLFLVVDGADVRADASIPSVGTSNNGISLTANSVITLELGNLSSTHPITLTTMKMDGSDKKPVGSAITLQVEHAAGAYR